MQSKHKNGRKNKFALRYKTSAQDARRNITKTTV